MDSVELTGIAEHWQCKEQGNITKLKRSEHNTKKGSLRFIEMCIMRDALSHGFYNGPHALQSAFLYPRCFPLNMTKDGK